MGGIRQAGFAVQYRDATANPAFFPTSHESSMYSSQATNLVEMDVTLTALGAILKPLSLLPPARYAPLGIEPDPETSRLSFNNQGRTEVWRPVSGSVVLRADDTTCRGLDVNRWDSVKSLLKSLPTAGGGKLHEGKLVEREAARLVTGWNLKGMFPNGDVVARKATVDDVSVSERAYADLGAWLHHCENSTNAPRDAMTSFQSLSFLGTCPRLAKVDIVLALLARQLAYPGLNDRVSDVASPVTGEKSVCGPLVYVNLDLPNVDLDEMGYQAKEGYARYMKDDKGNVVDTVGTTYVRVSAQLGPVESLEMRTVQDVTGKSGVVETGSFNYGVNSGNKKWGINAFGPS